MRGGLRASIVAVALSLGLSACPAMLSDNFQIVSDAAPSDDADEGNPSDATIENASTDIGSVDCCPDGPALDGSTPDAAPGPDNEGAADGAADSLINVATDGPIDVVTTCGNVDQACCVGGTCFGTGCCDPRSNQCVGNGTSCSSSASVCAGGSCQACGDFYLACCAGDVCNGGGCCNGATCVVEGSACGGGETCVAGLCGTCGGQGQTCCAGNACVTGQACVAGTCTPCGAAQEPCCADSTCTGGGTCCDTIDNVCYVTTGGASCDASLDVELDASPADSGAPDTGSALDSASAADTSVTEISLGYTGSEQSFAVPAGVTQIIVVAYGAGGGAECYGNSGGQGASETATLPVTPGETLVINVGGAGGYPTGDAGYCNVAGAGGFNGGGAGGTSLGYSGGGGGGASDVRQGGSALENRVVVAAGAGGAGAGNGGGGGGFGGTATGGAGGNGIGNIAAGGGSGGTQSAGGLGGTSGFSDGAGVPGGAGVGGNGGASGGASTGGGGGGGYYGGGGGGCGYSGAGGGGGGGSSYADPSATGVVMQAGVQSGNGQVMLFYESL
jgi:hypothetical protein